MFPSEQLICNFIAFSEIIDPGNNNKVSIVLARKRFHYDDDYDYLVGFHGENGGYGLFLNLVSKLHLC